MTRLIAALLAFAPLAAAAATSVFVMSISPARVEILVNGAIPRGLRPGEVSPEGVRLLKIERDTALLEVDGRRWQMRIGASTTASVVLHADSRGHFVANVLMNGIPVRALVDTGASAVSLNAVEARRLGIDAASGERILTSTAGGRRWVRRARIASVQLGDIVLRNVEAFVAEGGPEQLAIVLLGMSFLNHVDLQRSGSTLVLTQRH